MSKKILMIVGSLREKSLNYQLAEYIGEIAAPEAEISFLDYKDIPYMNQDIEYPAPKEIERVRQQVMGTDGVWIVTPEYNYSYPGVLKNLLDWLSRPLKPGDFFGPTAVSGKKVTVSGAGGNQAAKGAIESTKNLLKFIRMEVMEEPASGVVLGVESFQTDKINLSADSKKVLQNQVMKFLDFLNK